MILKTEALTDHITTRHTGNNVLLNDDVMVIPLELDAGEKDPEAEKTTEAQNKSPEVKKKTSEPQKKISEAEKKTSEVRKRHLEADEKVSNVKEPEVKRTKFDSNQYIQSYPLGYPPELVLKNAKSFPLQKSQSFCLAPKQVQQAPDLQYSHSFTLPKPPKHRIAHEKKPEPLKIKMKLKKGNQGQWCVV